MNALGPIDEVFLVPKVRRLLDRGEKLAKKLPGYRPIPAPVRESCDYHRYEGRFTLVFDDKRQPSLGVTDARNEQHLFPIAVPTEFRKAIEVNEVSAPSLSSLRILSALSHPLPTGEIIVLDIGSSDQVWADYDRELDYRRRTCSTIRDCPLLASTYHHGTQMQVIVRTPVAVPTVSDLPRVATRALTGDDLARAEKQPAAQPRTDGIYLSVPTCTAKEGWSRSALRFARDRNASWLEGNFSSWDAAILTSQHYSGDKTEFPCAIVGARIRCRIDFGGEDQRILLDGRLAGEWLDMVVSPPGKPARVESLHFEPLDEERLKSIDGD